MTEFDAAGVAVYALSYDEADALRDFRDAHGITYNLLSDPDYRVIQSFGILNTLIDPDDHPWYGIPYPGTYVLDGSGTITHKFFESNLAVRAGSDQLLRAVRGEAISSGAATEADTPSEVSMTVYLEGGSLTPTVQRDLVVQFNVPEGRHVYAEPAPEGSVSVDVALDPDDRLVQRPLQCPASENHSLLGTDEIFPVHHGQFQLRLPLTINGGLTAGDDNKLTLTGTVRWQACDDQVCDVPVSRDFELTVTFTKSPPVALFGAGAELEPNARAHFQKMTERRTQSD